MNKKDQYIPRKVAIYLRVSTDHQDEKYGEELQKNSIMKMIESRSNPIIENCLSFAGEKYIYYDDGISGTMDIKERPQFRKMMEDYDLAPKNNKPFDSIAVFKIDRLARKLKILINVIEFLDQRKIKLISVHENIDTTTPFGRAMLNIMGVIAELEVETIKERMSLGRNSAADSGVFMGNNTPLGYIKDKNKKLKIQKNEAEVVKRIFYSFIIQRKNPTEISNNLTSEKVLTPAAFSFKNKKTKAKYNQQSIYKWNDSMVRKILHNEIYTGNYFYNKTKNKKNLPKEEWIKSPTKHPPIISDSQFTKAHRLLESMKTHRNQNKRDTFTYLLSGVLTCNHCKKDIFNRTNWGGVKISKNKNGRVNYKYRCNRKSTNKYEKPCETIPIDGRQLEEHVLNIVKKILKNPKAAFNYKNTLKSTKIQERKLEKDLETSTDKINRLVKSKENCLAQHQLGYIDTKRLKSEMKEIDKNIKKENSILDSLKRKMDTQSMNKEYKENLKIFSKKYEKNLDNYFKDRQKTKELLNVLFDEIIIYSRPKKESDIVAGVKKENQQIPNKINMIMRLPEDIINELPKLEKEPLKGSNSKFVSGGR